MGFIYKITNDINDKIYIGQTINSIEYRFRSHINETNNSDKQNKFHQALLKLGINHFKVEQIEECPNEQLNEREQYWIQYYDSVNNGYNTTWGGSNGTHYDRQQLLNLWNQGLIIQEISDKVGIDRGLLGQILKTENITQEEINARRYLASRSQSSNRQIYQINPTNGEIIKKWERINDIERELNLSHSAIIKCCNKDKGRKTCGGFTWRYIEDYNYETDKEELIQYTIRDALKNAKHVLQYDKNNNFIQEFNNTKEAGAAVNKSDRNIARYCRGDRKDPNGYIWKYK